MNTEKREDEKNTEKNCEPEGDLEICAQLPVCKHAIVGNQVIASLAVQGAQRRLKQRDTTGRIPPFQSLHPVMEV